MNTTRSIAVIFALSVSLPGTLLPLRAERPPKLNQMQIERLTRDGDRLADQGDFLAALKKYTDAYLGVVSKIRGQDFLKAVEPSMFNRQELANEMLEQMKKEFTEDDLLLMDSAYKVLGLMSPDLQSETLVTKLLTEEVAGFYDPDNKRMVLIVEDGPKEDPGWFGRLLGVKPAFDKDEQKTTLAHELTHALQDQLYDLNAMEEGIQDDDDMLLAFSALVEGDATLLMFAEADGSQDISQMDPDSMRATFNLMSWMMPLAGGETYRKAPPIFRDSLTFPYFQGMLFALSIAGEDGWFSVHDAYARPPLSTEQILHPAKYLQADAIDVPQSVTIPSLASALSATWKHLGGNVLGELQTGIMLKRVAGGKNAALGWDGDRYEVFRNENGELAMVMVSIWDSPQDAQEFSDAFQTHRNANPHGTQSVFAADAARWIEQHADQVWIIDGFDDSTTEKIRAILADCEFQEKSFPLPQSEADREKSAAETTSGDR